jgi:hypothetical protein
MCICTECMSMPGAVGQPHFLHSVLRCTTLYYAGHPLRHGMVDCQQPFDLATRTTIHSSTAIAKVNPSTLVLLTKSMPAS